MKDKKIIVLAAAAVVLGTVAYFATSARKVKTPSLNGQNVLAPFNVADVSRIEIDGEKKLVLASGENGWTVESRYGYPADVAKIRKNVVKLGELKVGQVANGRKMKSSVKVALNGSGGWTLAALELGEMHMSKPKGQAAQFGGGSYPDGRYVKFGNHTVLVKDPLEAFDGDFRKWIDTSVCRVPSADVTAVKYSHGVENVELERKDSQWSLQGLKADEELDASKTYSLDSALSYLDFDDIADPKLTDAEFGFTTGSVYTVSLKDGTAYTAKIGNASGSGRYFRISAAFKPAGTNATENAEIAKKVDEFNGRTAKWTYLISSYSADSMTKRRSDLVKAKEEKKPESSGSAAE
jgi:hypothetical protein